MHNTQSPKKKQRSDDDGVSQFTIRPRAREDLAELRRCITESYLNDEIEDLETVKRLQEYLPIALKEDLDSEEVLMSRFGEGVDGHNFLVVAQDTTACSGRPGEKLAGCIGAKPHNPFELELVRLFVDKSHRGKGLGKQLVNFVLAYAEKHGYERVILWCGSPSGQALYKSMGFRGTIESYFFYRNVKNTRKLEKVALLGGTHGNELVGIHLVNEVWNCESRGGRELANKSFSLKAYIANEEAMKRCVRFVDRDLNRCFELDELLHPRKEESHKLETIRAKWLNEQLGPKCDIPTSIGRWKKEYPGRVDYLIDMHSTTSNMGICLITLGGDALTIRLAHALQKAFARRPDLPPFNLLVDVDFPRAKYNNIDSVPPSAICIEVGPLPHGTLNNHPLVEGTRFAVRESIRVIDEFNLRGDAVEAMNACTSSDSVVGYSLWKPLYFPTQTPESHTISAVLHPSLVGADFKALNKGDPLFVDLVSGEVCVRYEEEETAYPCFIGEAAYFPSKIAMWLCKKRDFAVYG